jgi:uncharacterized protein YbjQ (UPF0145 family)
MALGHRAEQGPWGYRHLMVDMHPWVTTANSFDGYKVVRNYGVVRGITVRSRSIFGNIGASFQTLAGGKISLYVELCERARGEAYELMITHAAEVGANALLAMRYDANEISPGVTEVLAYGTAVFIEPV